jgi:hypothetical protein
MRHIKNLVTTTAINTYPISLWDKSVTKVKYNLPATADLNFAMTQLMITGTFHQAICAQVPAHEFVPGTSQSAG